MRLWEEQKIKYPVYIFCKIPNIHKIKESNTIMKPWMLTEVEEDIDVLLEDLIGSGNRAQLIVHNDEHNTFDWVIKCFMEVCKHTQEQSEQLSYIIHFKGKATVKTGSLEELKPMKDALVERGLSAVIEEEKV